MSDAATAIPSVDIDGLVTPMSAAEALECWSGFVSFRPGEVSRAPPEAVLVNPGGGAGWYQHCHTETAPVRELGAWFLRDVTISGMLCTFRDGHLLDDGATPTQVGRDDLLRESLPLDTSIRRERSIRPDRPVLVVAGSGYAIWGHWLLDFLPRLGIARAILGARIDGFVIPLPSDTPGWVERLLVFFGGIDPAQLLRFDRATESITAAQVCLPSFAHSNYFLHSYLREFYRSFVANNDRPAAGRKVCISRKAFGAVSRSLARRFIQQDSFEATAVRHGFELVHPETLPFDEQIALFNNAAVVVGEFGSGLHSAVFSPPGTIIGQFAMPNPIQSRIAGLCDHRSAYLFADEETQDANGVIDMSVREAEIEAFFDAVSAMQPAEA